MAVAVPDWLSKRGGRLREAGTGHTWFVIFDDEPQYRVTPIPAGGKFSCHVVQTVNGKRLDSGSVHPSADEAMGGGLEDLRKALGW